MPSCSNVSLRSWTFEGGVVSLIPAEILFQIFSFDRNAWFGLGKRMPLKAEWSTLSPGRP